MLLPSDLAATLRAKEHVSSAAIAASLALEMSNPENVRTLTAVPDHPALLISQPGLNLQSLERFSPSPHRTIAAVSLDTAKDLHAYVLAQTQLRPVGSAGTNEPAYHQPAIFASRKNQQLIAYLDYHHANSARWLDHTASVKYTYSTQFQKWLELNNKPMSQEAFALFIDEQLPDFKSPDGATMLSFASALEINSDQKFKSVSTLSSGVQQLVFTDDRKGDVSTPLVEKFEIAVPIWQGSQPVLIEARLFHRLVDLKDSGGQPTGAKGLKFWYALRQVDRIIDQLFAEEVDFLRTAFNGIAPVYAGLPPSAPTPLPLK